MEKIVVVGVLTEDARLSPKNGKTGLVNVRSQIKVDLNAPKTNRRPALSEQDQALPFWTWFIENPRDRSIA